MIRNLLAFAVLGVAVACFFRVMLMLDFNKRVYNHRPGSCRKVEGIEYGSEDIAVVEDEGVAFVTSGVMAAFGLMKDVKGQIFLYDFHREGEQFKAVPLEINGDFKQDSFFPHGISYFLKSAGRVRLFVINHSNKYESAVVVFDWDRGSTQLDFVKTITDVKFVGSNNLAAVSEDSFILTNYGSAQSTATMLLQDFLSLPTGSVLYYDGKGSRYLISPAATPNGVVVHPDGKHVIIAHSNGKKIAVYKLQDNYHSLTLVADVPLMTLTDNLSIDKEGHVWVGALPVYKDTLNYVKQCDNDDVHAPSQVLRVKFANDFKSWEVTEPFTDDGRFVSASTVAAAFKNQLLIGTLCRQLVHCYYNSETA